MQLESFTISEMVKPLAVQIHDWIEDAKILHGIKKKDLADRLNISPTQLSNLLRGRNKWTSDQIDKLCIALDITLGDLGSYNEIEVTPQEHIELYRKLQYVLTKTKRSEKVVKAAIDAAFKEVKEDESKNNRSR